MNTLNRTIIICASAEQEAQAKRAYLSCYSKGWKVGPIKAIHLDDFKEWLQSGKRGVVKALDDVNFDPKKFPDHFPKGSQNWWITPKATSPDWEHFEHYHTINATPHEVLRAYHPDGTMLHEIKGTNDQVEIPGEVHEKMRRHNKGVVLTHNHPAGHTYEHGHPKRQGNGFSEEDVKFATDVSAREMRAVTPIHTYSIKPPEGRGRFTKLDGVKIQLAYEEAKRDAIHDLFGKVARGEMPLDRANSEFAHHLWSHISNKLGFQYNRTPHKYLMGHEDYND